MPPQFAVFINNGSYYFPPSVTSRSQQQIASGFALPKLTLVLQTEYQVLADVGRDPVLEHSSVRWAEADKRLGCVWTKQGP